jgi:hypothetical protein
MHSGTQQGLRIEKMSMDCVARPFHLKKVRQNNKVSWNQDGETKWIQEPMMSTVINHV